jgi:hypothetical protein
MDRLTWWRPLGRDVRGDRVSLLLDSYRWRAMWVHHGRGRGGDSLPAREWWQRAHLGWCVPSWAVKWGIFGVKTRQMASNGMLGAWVCGADQEGVVRLIGFVSTNSGGSARMMVKWAAVDVWANGAWAEMTDRWAGMVLASRRGCEVRRRVSPALSLPLAEAEGCTRGRDGLAGQWV